MEPDVSYVQVRAAFSVKELQKKANAEIPEVLYEDNNIEDDNYTIKVTKKDVLKITPKGELIEIRLPLKVYAKARINLGFFKKEQEASFEVTPIYLSRIKVLPDWKIETKTSSNGYDWITKPKISIGPVDIDIAPYIEGLLDKEQDRIASEVDKQIADNLNIKSHVEKAWELIQSPIAISEKHNAWIKISPKEVFFVPLTGDTAIIRAGIGIKGITESFVGEKPGVIYQPLPNLSVYSPNEDAFNINLLARVSFEKASSIARENLVGQTFTFDDNKYAIKVEDIDIYGSGEKIVVKTRLSGSINGEIFLKGIPIYDSTTMTIKIKNLDYDMDTKNQLLKTADWLAHGTFVKKMEKNFYFPVKPQIDEAKNYIQTMLNNNKVNPYVIVNGKINELIPKKLLIIDDYFLIQINASGKLDLNITGL